MEKQVRSLFELKEPNGRYNWALVEPGVIYTIKNMGFETNIFLGELFSGSAKSMCVDRKLKIAISTKPDQIHVSFHPES